MTTARREFLYENGWEEKEVFDKMGGLQFRRRISSMTMTCLGNSLPRK